MVLRKVALILIAYSCLSRSAAQEVLPKAVSATAAVPRDFSETVVPITEFKIRVDPKTHLIWPSTNPMSYIDLGAVYGGGTGFCLDPACRFIGTNYHVAMLARPSKIKGQRVVQTYLATGPDDEDATVNDSPYLSPIKYTVSRDLAIFELEHSLPHHRGVAFSLDDLLVGQEVDIYAYPKEGLNPIRRLMHFQGTFKGQTTTGLLAFDYGLAANKAIRPGASGGIVVDSKTQQIVGILSEIEGNGESIALAVPVQSLVDFLSKEQPYLAHRIFPSTKGMISPVSADLYPRFVPAPPGRVLQHRPEEPSEVKLLRIKAQLLADSMKDFIAVQTFEWGSRDKVAAESAYEVRVVDGYQRFRKYPDGTEELQDVPFPRLSNVIVPGGEWSELPAMVGTELGLKIQQAADVVVNERRMKVFQYRADPEDTICRFRTEADFVLFKVNKIATVACYGEVWTDQDTNILRMSRHFELCGKWKDCQAVVTYGWLQRTGEAPRLIPLTIATQCEFNKKVYWCRGLFTNYRVFSSRVRFLSSVQIAN